MELLFHRQPKLGYERRLRCAKTSLPRTRSLGFVYVGGYAKTRGLFFSDDFVSIISLNLRNHIKVS